MTGIDVSTPVKVGLAFLGLGFLFHLIGFSAPFWHVQEKTEMGLNTKAYYGLWKSCMEHRYTRHSPFDVCHSLVDGNRAADYIRATQFFQTVGFLSSLVSAVLLLLGIFVSGCNDSRILPALSAVVALAAAGCIILGCIIFGGHYAEKPHLSWAFALALVGGLFFAVAGVVLILATFLAKNVKK